MEVGSFQRHFVIRTYRVSPDSWVFVVGISGGKPAYVFVILIQEAQGHKYSAGHVILLPLTEYLLLLLSIVLYHLILQYFSLHFILPHFKSCSRLFCDWLLLSVLFLFKLANCLHIVSQMCFDCVFYWKWIACVILCWLKKKWKLFIPT